MQVDCGGGGQCNGKNPRSCAIYRSAPRARNRPGALLGSIVLAPTSPHKCNYSSPHLSFPPPLLKSGYARHLRHLPSSLVLPARACCPPPSVSVASSSRPHPLPEWGCLIFAGPKNPPDGKSVQEQQDAIAKDCITVIVTKLMELRSLGKLG